MKNEVMGCACAIVVALIHKGRFDDTKSKDELRKELSETLISVGEALGK